MVTKPNIIILFLSMCPLTLFEFVMLKTFTEQIEIIEIKGGFGPK